MLFSERQDTGLQPSDSLPNHSSHSVLPASPPVHSPPRLALLTSCKLFQMLFPKLYCPLTRRETPRLLLHPARPRYTSQRSRKPRPKPTLLEESLGFAVTGSIIRSVCYVCYVLYRQISSTVAAERRNRNVVKQLGAEPGRKPGITVVYFNFEREEPRGKDNS
jgi:hypothetical protein